jgi:endogenous inhibitor of DNA gyrase (YacG/DUF329 family)
MTDRSDNVVPLRRPRALPCPICKKPAAMEYRPFCSKRCADLDLHKWLGEGYSIPAVEPPDGMDGDDQA